ncbi:hypothetical protein [Undibacterium terreum]|uniref:Uncharacterized protein n=1 Tax=Undibacterium terreum TaxID=1224302 RepID=A0A916XQV2_9BURK|nr:hypothetical protein [Undibacterium terreum]GGC93481.1 hypothetical protein GCM10011396_45950 [Undibacterium terreum]
MTENTQFEKTFSVDGDEFQFYGSAGKVLSVTYTSNTKVRQTNQVFAISGTVSGTSHVTSSVEEFTDLWLRDDNGAETNFRLRGRLPAREGHTIFKVRLAGKKVIADPEQVGTLDSARNVPYSMFNHDTGNYLFRYPTKVFTQTGESAGWVPRPDALTWIIMIFCILLWGIGLIPIVYILVKAYKFGDLQEKCLDIQKRIELEHLEFLKHLKKKNLSVPVETEDTLDELNSQ